MTDYYISPGQTVSDMTLGGSHEDELYILKGGTAVDMIADYFGFIYVDGVASGSQIRSGGYESVQSGVSYDATVYNGGYEWVGGNNATAVAHNVTVESGAVEVLRARGIASSTVLAGGEEQVWSGGQERVYHATQNITVGAGGSVVIYSGGSTLNDTLSGGKEIVQAGGSSSDTTVNAGSHLIVDSGGTVFDPQLVTNGVLKISAGGAVSGVAQFGGGHDSLIFLADLPTSNFTISGFATTDKIDFRSLSYSSANQVNLLSDNVLQITTPSATYDMSFASTDNFTGKYFQLSPDGSGGTNIILNSHQ